MALWGRIFGQAAVGNTEYEQAIALFDRGCYAEAIPAFENAAKRAPVDSLIGRLAHFYLVESLSAVAIGQLNGDWSSDSTKRTRDCEAAIAILDRAIALNPDYADLHGRLARALFYSCDFAEALTAADRALTINPAYGHALLLRGNALYALGRRAEGLQAARQAMALGTATPLQQRRLAAALRADQQGESACVVEYLHRMVDEDAELIDSLARQMRTSTAGMESGAPELSVAAYREAVECHPDYADLRNNLGVALHTAGRFAEASVEFARAIRINPRYVEAYVNRGLALERLGQATAAYTAYHAALSLDAKHPVAHARIAALKAAGTAARVVET